MARKKAVEAATRPDAPRLRAVAITVKDVLGIREFAVQPGQITEITGLNGAGKTSVLQGIAMALGGGNISTIARLPQDGDEKVEPEVVLVLSAEDGSEAYRVKYDESGRDIKMRLGDSAALKDLDMPPMAWLRDAWDAKGANPVEFLLAKDPERIGMILEAVKLELDRERLGAILGPLKVHVGTLPDGLAALDELKLVHEAIYNARRGTNRSKDEKAKAAEQMRQTAPVTVDDLQGALAAEQQAVSNLAAEIGATEGKAQADAQRLQEGATAAFRQASSESKAAADAEIAQLTREHEELAASIRANAEKRVTEALAETRTAIDAAETRRDLQIEEARAALEAKKGAIEKERAAVDAALLEKRQKLEAAKVKLATLQEQDRIAARDKGLRDQAAVFEREADELAAESKAMSAALEALEEYRLNLIKSIPIEGLQIDGKQLLADGIPLDQQNTERRVGIAVEVGALRVRRLPLLLIDGAESLDEDHEIALAKKLKEKGIQAIMTRVIRKAESEAERLEARDLFGNKQ